MSLNENTLISLIKKSSKVDELDLSNAKKTSIHLGVSILDVLQGRSLLTEKDLGSILAEYFNREYVNLRIIDINPDVLNLIPEDIAAEKQVVAFDKNKEHVSIAVSDPKDLDLIENIKKTIGERKVKVFVSTPDEIRDSLKAYKLQEKKTKTPKDAEKSDESAITLLNRIIDQAVREEASDIHIEPLEDMLLVRVRVDGVLHDEGAYPRQSHQSLIARVKILSDLKLDEQRLPQDGQFSFKTKSVDKVSLRVSVSPTVYGEKAVLRILKTSVSRFNLEDLGFLEDDLELIQRSIDKTHGMFLVTGPTGSGKTTTLYTILGILNKADVNIITIEDPVENRIKRVNQIQVNPVINLTFASGLRSILRQDPDIVMVGEIRDKETAVIAVNAAMTGHLVFSTVHANTASGVIPRMIDLGSEPFLLASTLNLVVAQRLVRVLCTRCKKKVALDKVLKSKLATVKGSVKSAVFAKVKSNYKAEGCSHCFNTGFKGRIGIFEILPINDRIKELIVSRASSQEVWKEARKQGARSMMEDGFVKVTKGLTTLEEVFRVIS